ncbi:MAG TPA: prepilin-type N-terminal cleavage/methylation domain-containing protein [Atribacteraceae bacterium]|nr:prepilin-type N-terminal cleavage/methylation domain-containing protein [Atribacteraceae bacterium]
MKILSRGKSASDYGFTLIELLLALTLLVFFLGGAFAFNLFGLRTFAAGEMQTDVHQVLRRTAERITNELRYATHIELHSQVATVPDGYLIIDSSSLANHSNNLSFSFVFPPGENQVMEFTIKAENISTAARIQTRVYEISSSVFLNNNPAVVKHNCNGALGPCTVVGYLLPPTL